MKINKVKEALEGLFESAKAGIHGSVEVAKGARESCKVYFQSDNYESDLDEVIAKIAILKPRNQKKFDHIANRKIRVALKTQYILSQAKFLVASSAVIGAEVGLFIGGPQGALTGGSLGTAAGAICISFVAGQVIVRRLGVADQFAYS